ncbi:MAG: hypothetical protein PHU12_04705 [Candidatus Aenigmarchaeota archaeon]|nr:hypothetical protein [Candidatus Aenigmarchaeota archaeon]
MNKIITVLVALLIVTSISGCISLGKKTTSGATGLGLEIVNFTSSADTVRSNRTLTVTMQLQNQGDYKVSKDSGLALLIMPSDWTVAPGKAQAYTKDIGFEDSVRGTPMGTHVFRWTLTAPSLPEGISRPDSIETRVFYDYETRASGKIYVYPEAELLSAREKGEKINTLTYESTKGPIGIAINVLPDPVSVYSPGETFTLTITLTNQEKGTIYSQLINTSDYTLQELNRNKVQLSVSLPDFNITNTCAGTVEFYGDTDTATAICDIKVPNVPSTKQPYPISVTAKYGYQIAKSLDVTVNGV